MRSTKTSAVLLVAAVSIIALSVFAAETAFFKGHVNGRVAGFEKTDPEMFRARPLDNRFYTEVWFHEMQFPADNIIIIVQVQLHNLGFSRGNADCYITVSDPKGISGDLGSYSPDEVRIDPQGFGLSIGPHRWELEGDRYRIRYRGETVQADLDYEILTPSFQQGDGKTTFEGTDDFVKYNFPIPWARVRGKVTIGGKTRELDGWGSMNHDWQVLSPLRYPGNWRAFWLYSDDATVSIVRCSSIHLEGKWVERLMVAERGKVLFSSHDYRLEELDPEPVEGGAVPCPRRYRVLAEHGPDRLSGEISVTAIQEKGNILAEYPYLFRKIAELIVSETWTYRFWCDYEFELVMDGETRKIAGRGTGNYVDSVEVKK